MVLKLLAYVWYISIFVSTQSGSTVLATDPCVCLQHYIGNLDKPVFLAHTIDTGDIDRFFVLEKSGQILEFPADSSKSASKPYLDISDRVVKQTSTDSVIGLLGFTLHPNFAANWKIYVFYIRKSSDQLVAAVVSEFTGKTKYESDPDSERILLEIPQPKEQENGGHIFFGDDGYLYISVGDGGLEDEEQAQNSYSLLGKILRIDLNSRTPGVNYTIPSDNPFLEHGQHGAKEIFAKGARNMWRCSVDAGNVQTGEGKGRIFCGDVGHDLYEEVNIIQKGGNYGWNNREGFECRPGKLCHDMDDEIFPISVYDHTITRAAIIGGYVYRGSKIPQLEGQYIYGDASSGEMFRLTDENKETHWPSHLLVVCDKDQCPCHARGEKPRHILSFSSDKYEELYVMTTTSLIAPSAKGSIYKIVAPVPPGAFSDGLTCGANATQVDKLLVLFFFLVLYIRFD